MEARRIRSVDQVLETFAMRFGSVFNRDNCIVDEMLDSDDMTHDEVTVRLTNHTIPHLLH